MTGQAAGDGFLFAPPAVTLTLRGGYDRAFAGDSVFDDAIEQLTLGRGDFSAPSWAADLAFRVSPRVDVVLGAAYAHSNARSEFRAFETTEGEEPIRQTTSLRRIPVTAGLKAYLAPRGRAVGRFAWVPARVAPYVGAGGGAMWYRLRQEGEFLEANPGNPDRPFIISGMLESSRATPAAYGSAGVDVSLTPRLALTTEARYTWARSPGAGDYADYDHIDLSGVAATAGISLRF